jgi:hypothetical protein
MARRLATLLTANENKYSLKLWHSESVVNRYITLAQPATPAMKGLNDRNSPMRTNSED